MIDRYSVEKLVDGHTAEALKAAAQGRLASLAAADHPRRRRIWLLLGLRVLALAGARPLAALGEQRKN